MKSGAVTLSIIALAACSDTVGLDSLEDSLTLDAAIDDLGDMGLLFGAGPLAAPSAVDTRTVTHTAT